MSSLAVSFYTMPHSYFELIQGFFLVHRQHCTLQAFEQFGALYMHNHDDKYPSRPGFKHGISRLGLQAPVDTNEPSGPTSKCSDNTANKLELGPDRSTCAEPDMPLSQIKLPSLVSELLGDCFLNKCDVRMECTALINPVNATHWFNAGSMFGQCRRLWPNIGSTLLWLYILIGSVDNTQLRIFHQYNVFVSDWISSFTHFDPYIVPLDMKGWICHFVKGQIHPFITKGTV